MTPDAQQPEQEYVVMRNGQIRRKRTRPHTPTPAHWCNKSQIDCAKETKRIWDEAARAATLTAYEKFSATLRKESPDTIQATEKDGDLHAWNGQTIDRVLQSLRQQAGEQ